MHLGVANTMASVRENWWIPKLRAKVKKVIKNCNICKVYSTKPYGVPSTSALPEYRTEGSRPFEVTGVEFARPFLYEVSKKEEGKCCVIIFTCACSRAVRLEVARTQTADESRASWMPLSRDGQDLAASSRIMPKCLRLQQIGSRQWEKVRSCRIT